MPGLYINDGGETGSALSAALANIANNFSPKTQAEAELLRLQTEGKNWENRGLSDKTLATEAGITAAGQLPSALGAEIGKIAQPGGMAPGGASSDGNAAAANGAPNLSPSARGQIRLPGGIMGDMLAGRYAQGGDFNDIRSGIELGQQQTMGPTNTFQARGRIGEANAIADNASRNRITEAGAIAPIDVWKSTQIAGNATDNEIRKAGAVAPVDVAKATAIARNAPFDVTAGQNHVVPPATTIPGGPQLTGGGSNIDANGNVVTPGPSLYDKTFDEAQSKADQKNADDAYNAGNEARQAMPKLDDLLALGSQLHNETVPGRISAALQSALQDKLGVSFTDKGAAIAEVNKRVAALVGALHGSFGITRLAQPEIAALQRSLPSALQDPRVFNDIVNEMRAGATQQIRAGEIAEKVQNKEITATEGRRQLTEVMRDDPTARLRQKYPSLFSTDGGGGAGGDGSGGSGGGGPRKRKYDRNGNLL
jgi:hypothetical protein